MKKTLLAGFAALAAGAALAAANDVLITFSTPGPDKYADGTTVLDGERYALVWSQDLAGFSFNADGEAVGGKVVLKAPVAKGGRCPTVVFEIDADYAASAFPGGEYAVYLLDTRTFAPDGTATVAGTKVNTTGLVGGSVNVGTGTLGSQTGTAAKATDLPAGADVPKPEVTGIRVFEGNVYVTVKGTVPYLAYGLTEGATPTEVTEAVGTPEPGKVNPEEEILLVTPVKEGGGFFKVGRE